jgi:hypothetical protein
MVRTRPPPTPSIAPSHTLTLALTLALTLTLARALTRALALPPITLPPRLRHHRYRTNYSMAEPLLWGRGKGCSFVTEPCIGGPSGTMTGMCTDSSATGCTADYRSKGVCNLRSWPSAVTPAYFADATLGGAIAQVRA